MAGRGRSTTPPAKSHGIDHDAVISCEASTANQFFSQALQNANGTAAMSIAIVELAHFGTGILPWLSASCWFKHLPATTRQVEDYSQLSSILSSMKTLASPNNLAGLAGALGILLLWYRRFTAFRQL